MRKTTFIALIAIAAAGLSAIPAHADGEYLAGAAKIEISPPSTGHRVGQLCPSKFDGPSVWDFDEPYLDQNGNGVYDLGEPYCDANANGRYDGIWVVGAANHHANVLNDPLWARAFAVSDGTDNTRRRECRLARVVQLGHRSSKDDRARSTRRSRARHRVGKPQRIDTRQHRSVGAGRQPARHRPHIRRERLLHGIP